MLSECIGKSIIWYVTLTYSVRKVLPKNKLDHLSEALAAAHAFFQLIHLRIEHPARGF